MQLFNILSRIVSKYIYIGDSTAKFVVCFFLLPGGLLNCLLPAIQPLESYDASSVFVIVLVEVIGLMNIGIGLHLLYGTVRKYWQLKKEEKKLQNRIMML